MAVVVLSSVNANRFFATLRMTSWDEGLRSSACHPERSEGSMNAKG